MIREKTYTDFYNKFKTGDEITVNILMKVLRISRPTSTKFIEELIHFSVIEPIFTKELDKCYKIIK